MISPTLDYELESEAYQLQKKGEMFGKFRVSHMGGGGRILNPKKLLNLSFLY